MGLSREYPHSFEDALRLATEMLSKDAGLVSRGVVDTEAEQIVCAAYRRATGEGMSRLELFTRMKDRFPEEAGEQVIIMSGARAEGKILQHLTGFQCFMDHEYEVTPDVLVPRPETELLAAVAIEDLAGKEPRLGLEVGLGSGILSIELLSAFDDLKMIASELTDGAAACAKKNAERILGKSAQSRLMIVRAKHSGEVLEPLQSQLEAPLRPDFLISNPPYLTSEDSIESDVLAHEPHTALFAPKEDALYFYRRIAEDARSVLVPRGSVYLETPAERAAEIGRVFEGFGWECQLLLDFNSRPRILKGTLTGKGTYNG